MPGLCQISPESYIQFQVPCFRESLDLQEDGGKLQWDRHANSLDC